jgi:NADPH2:quinone reductase
MHAVVQRAFGGPEQLVVEEVPDPEAGVGQVRVAVEAAGVHLLDTTIREGRPGPFGIAELPMTPGREVVGVVDVIGPGVDASWVGRRVAAHLGAASGGYASRALVPVEALIPLAAGVDAAEAVAMIGTGRTALGILEEAQLSPDDVVLVTAAAGGLGSLLVQAAEAAGATVAGVAGGPAKVRLVRSLGADVAVDYLQPTWPDHLRVGLGERRPSVALDGVGGEVGRRAFELVRPGGRIVLFGYTAGSPMPLSAEDLFASGVSVTAAVGPRMFARPGGIQALAVDAVAKLTRGEWRPVVTRFPLTDAGVAHQALVDRRTTGKVVLVP